MPELRVKIERLKDCFSREFPDFEVLIRSDTLDAGTGEYDVISFELRKENEKPVMVGHEGI